MTIAIIDDDYIDRLVSKKLINRLSADVETLEFTNALDALQYFTEHANQINKLPDAVLLDIRMPQMSGWEYMEQYLKIKPSLIKHPKHYIYTSSIDPGDFNAQHQEVEGMYTKPFENSSLLEIIQSGMSED